MVDLIFLRIKSKFIQTDQTWTGIKFWVRVSPGCEIMFVLLMCKRMQQVGAIQDIRLLKWHHAVQLMSTRYLLGFVTNGTRMYNFPILASFEGSFATAPGFLWTLSFHGNFLNPRGFTLEPKTLSSVHYGKPMVPWEKPTGHRASRLGVKKRTRSRRWPSFWLCDSRFHSFLLEKEEISNNI